MAENSDRRVGEAFRQAAEVTPAQAAPGGARFEILRYDGPPPLERRTEDFWAENQETVDYATAGLDAISGNFHTMTQEMMVAAHELGREDIADQINKIWDRSNAGHAEDMKFASPDGYYLYLQQRMGANTELGGAYERIIQENPALSERLGQNVSYAEAAAANRELIPETEGLVNGLGSAMVEEGYMQEANLAPAGPAGPGRNLG